MRLAGRLGLVGFLNLEGFAVFGGSYGWWLGMSRCGLLRVGLWLAGVCGRWGRRVLVGGVVCVLLGFAEPAFAASSHTAYVTNRDSDSVTPIDTATNTAGPAITVGRDPFGVAITPDDRTAYVTNGGSDSVTPIDTATNTAGPAITVGAAPFEVAITPDGKTAYVVNGGSDSVTPIDTATNTAGPAITVGGAPFGVAITPDQPPAAAFSATVAPAGSASSFDASASADLDGTITSYRWDFGDGSSQMTTSSAVSHVYARAGSYTATLTVTDDQDCSTALVFTGQTASCNGGPQARTTREVIVRAVLTPSPPVVKIGPPSAQVSSPTNGARYGRGQVVHASYNCLEGTGGPGISSCVGTVPNGQAINTSRVGKHSFAVTASSKDGQTATSTLSYTVRLPDNRFRVSRIMTQRNGTITLRVKVPGRGTINVVETAWKNNRARAAVLLQPAPRRFVYARARRSAHRASTLRVRVTPNALGRRLVHHHTYRATLRLWVTYTPSGGKQRKQGFYGLHLPR